MTSKFLRIITHWSNVVTAGNVKKWLQTKVNEKQKASVLGEGGVWLRLADAVISDTLVGVDVRLLNDLDRSDLIDKILVKKDEIDIYSFLNYIRVEVHDCTHDEQIVLSCVTNTVFEWKR